MRKILLSGSVKITSDCAAMNIIESTNPPVVMVTAETRVPLRNE